MKLQIFLTISFLFFSSYTAFSQQDWEKQSLESPKTVLSEAQKMYENAVKTQNTPAIIQALILKIRCKTLIDPADFPIFLQQLDSIIQQCQLLPEKALLASLAAELYQEYYNRNQYKIRQRSSLNDYIPTDRSEWSANLFIKTIFSYALTAIEYKQALQKIPVRDYQLTLLTGKDSEILRPTLYDFLCHRSIDQLKRLQYSDINNYFQQHQISSDSILAPLNKFIHYSLAVHPYDVKSNILKIYQQLLQFRLHAGHNPALLIADLERIEYAQTIQNSSPLYLENLKQLAQEYENTPYVTEVLYKEALYYEQHLSSTPLTDREKALTIAQEGIKKYPTYKRIGLLKQLIEEIKHPILSVSTTSTIFQGTNLQLNITYANINKLQVKIHKLDTSTWAYYQKTSTNHPKTLIVNKTFLLPQSLLRQDTTFSLTVKQPGLYLITCSTPGQKSISQPFFYNRLYTVTRKEKNKVEFLVRDAQSGKPIKGALVSIYTTTRPYQKITEFSTNQEGKAFYTPAKNGSFHYEVINHQNPNGIWHNTYFHSEQHPQKENLLNLFTDRKIYRPGETVNYCGISWHTTPDSSFINSGKEYKVRFYDSNHKNIAEQTLSTNDWGSFSGNFLIPREILNGDFTIETDEGSTMIQVTEYKRPEIEIILDTLKQSYRFGDTISISGLIQSYSGIALPNSKITYQIVLRSFYRWQNRDENIQEGTLFSNQQGEFDFHFFARPPYLSSSTTYFNGYYYEIKISASDPKGETQQTTQILKIGKEPFQLTMESADYFNKLLPVIIHIRTLNPNTQPVGKTIHYTISELPPLKNLGDLYNPDSAIINRIIQQGTFNTLQDSLVLHLASSPSGAYLVTAKAIQDNDTLVQKKIIYLYTPQDKRPPILTYNWFIPQHIHCNPEEKAIIDLGTSASDVYVLCELYNNRGRLEQKQFILSNEIKQLSFPYKATYGPEICLIISFVKDGHFFCNTTPIYKKQEPQQLQIKAQSFRDKLQPGQKEEWRFLVTTQDGSPVQAELMAVMYDRSLDQLLPNNWYFHPLAFLPPSCLPWNENFNRNTYFYFSFNRKSIAVPPLQFDKLNLLGLNLYSSRDETFEDLCVKESAFDLGTMTENKQMLHTRNSSGAILKEQATIQTRQATAPLLLPVTSLRQNFSETAFFYPQLVTNEKGETVFQFRVPDAVTGWKFMALAHSRNLQYGLIERDIVTLKKLSIVPNMPRFFRSGDSVVVKARIHNLDTQTLQGTAKLELFNPVNNQILLIRKSNFTVKEKDNIYVSFGFYVPQGLSVAGCRFTAATTHFSDGEQHLIAIAPNEILLTEATPIFSTKSGEHTYKLSATNPVRTDYRLALELTANPVWYAVMALPSLQQPKSESVTDLCASFYINAMASYIARSNPAIVSAINRWNTVPSPILQSELAQNNELQSILLQVSPWVNDAQTQTQQIQSLQQLFNTNRLEHTQQLILQKIRKLQNTEGGWSWFKNSPANRFITAHMLIVMARINLIAQTEYSQSEKMMQIRAIRYLDKSIQEDFKRKSDSDQILPDQILYLYTRSLYRDIPLGDALKAHKYYFSLAQKQWTALSLYEKALIATTMLHYGDNVTARKIISSLKEYATISPELGMYWAGNTSHFSSVHSPLLTQVAILEAIFETEGHSQDIDLMKQWLLRQKQTQNWGNEAATVDAIYALLLTGNSPLNQKEQLTIAIGHYHFHTDTLNQELGYFKTSFPASKITSDMDLVTIRKQFDSPTWGGLYLQYYTPLQNIRKKNNPVLNIEKKIFVKGKNNTNSQLYLPSEGLKIGDQVIVRLTVKADRDLQYVYIKDLRAACLEPVRQTSGLQGQYGISWYQETKDASTNYFFTNLPKGTYVFEYPLWVNQSGKYQDGIAIIQCMYAPEFVSYSLSGEMQVP